MRRSIGFVTCSPQEPFLLTTPSSPRPSAACCCLPCGFVVCRAPRQVLRPCPREGHAAASWGTNSMLVFGGWGRGIRNDLFILDKLPAPGPEPGGQAEPAPCRWAWRVPLVAGRKPAIRCVRACLRYRHTRHQQRYHLPACNPPPPPALRPPPGHAPAPAVAHAVHAALPCCCPTHLPTHPPTRPSSRPVLWRAVRAPPPPHGCCCAGTATAPRAAGATASCWPCLAACSKAATRRR